MRKRLIIALISLIMVSSMAGCSLSKTIDLTDETVESTEAEYTSDLSDVEATITLNKDEISVDGEGVEVDGTIATLTSSGTYSISGTLDDG